MEVVLKINIQDKYKFPEYASRNSCDEWCPLFLWDGESHDFCAALQSRTDAATVKCPFFNTHEYVLDIK